MVRCPRDFRAICTAVAPDAVGTLRIYNPTPPVYDGHLVPCSSDHNRAIMPNCELQPRELLKNVPTRGQRLLRTARKTLSSLKNKSTASNIGFDAVALPS